MDPLPQLPHVDWPVKDADGTFHVTEQVASDLYVYIATLVTYTTSQYEKCSLNAP